ncbi:MAG TPA: hypothetical protein VNV42_02230 [Solirubrobacteraceae bacterium]|nr:hypothetical protein [Solirubrobacteraceae bacterium]
MVGVSKKTSTPTVGQPTPTTTSRGRFRSVRAAAWLGDRLLALLAGLAAATPVIAATVRAIEAGWVPVADRGIIATRAHDVFTSHAPLVGQYTLAGEVTGRATHSLGPMLFWLLAPTAYGGSDVGMTITMGALNTLCVIGCVALARRRGGRVLMVLTAAAIALMCQSLAAETFHDVWNPSAGLFPFTLLIFLCWSVACGEYRLLPLAVLVGSFAVQAHLAYLPPTLALLAVGLGGLAAGATAARRRRTGDAPTGALDGERPTPLDRHGAADARAGGGLWDTVARWNGGVWRTLKRRRAAIGWTLATLVVLAFCWSATIDGQLTEHPGNLTLVMESATKHKQTLGDEVGWHAMVRAVGIVPWWLQEPKSRWQRKYEVRERPSALAVNSTIATLAALALIAIVAPMRRRRDLATMALTALVLCPALAAVAASTPTPRRLSATLGYTMWWGSQAGMFVWLALGWTLLVVTAGGAALAANAVRRRHRAAHRSRVDTLAGGSFEHTNQPAPATRKTPSPQTPTSPRAVRGRLTALGGVALTLAGIGGAVAVGNAVAAKGKPDEHQVTYKPIKAIDARLARLVPGGGSVLLEGELDGAEMPVKPAVRYFLVTRGTRVLAPGSELRLGTWYELYKRPYREALYLSDVPRPPVKHVPLAFRVRFREGKTVNTVYVWRSPHPGR